MWRNFRFLNVTNVEKSEVSPQVEQLQIYPHDRGGEILNFSTYGMCVICKVDVVFCKMAFVASYAVLLWFTLFLVKCVLS